MTTTRMHSLMDTFKRKVQLTQIIRSQQYIRDALQRKRAFYNEYCGQWLAIEIELAKNTSRRRPRRPNAAANSKAIVPEDLKRTYIREFLRERLREYAQEVYACQEEETQPLRPIMPRFQHLLTPENLRGLVVRALAEKQEWPQLQAKEAAKLVRR